MIATSTSVPTSPVHGSVRSAEPRDDDALADLFADSQLAPATVAPERDHGHLLVLDVDGHVRAAEYIVIDEPRACAQLQLLVVDGTLGAAARDVEDRMFGVALALSEAFGCTELEVVASASVGSRRRSRGAR